MVVGGAGGKSCCGCEFVAQTDPYIILQAANAKPRNNDFVSFGGEVSD